MAIKDTYINTHSGTKQSDRMPKALAPEYVQIDERTFEDLVSQVAAMAPRIRFYTENSSAGNWKPFFERYYNYAKKVLDVAALEGDIARGNVPAHMALILAFVKLFAVQQSGLNRLTQRQMDFYYKQVLGFEPRKGAYGAVPVIVELAKPVQRVFLPKGTLFEAGKDEQNRPIYYESKYDATLNKAQVVTMKKQIEHQFFNLSGANPSVAENLSVYLDCKDLLLKDGKRVITITCSGFKSDGVVVEYTAEKGWEKVDMNSSNMLTILESKPALAPYNAAVHGECFETDSPMLRLTSTNWDAISKLLEKEIKLKVSIENSQDFVITSSLGLVENRRGAMPFGTKCHKDDFFTITLPHIPDNQDLNKAKDKLCIVFNKNATVIWDVKKESEYTQQSTRSPQTLDISLKTDAYDLDLYNQKLAMFLSGTSENNPGTAVNPVELLQPITVSYDYTAKAVKAAFIAESAASDIKKEALARFYKTEADSNLFIGLENMPDNGQLNLMVTMDPYITQDIKDIQWNLFDGCEWHALRKADLLYDTTNGLRQSGIIHLNIIHAGVLWLKADFTGKYNFKGLKDITTQVVELIPSPTSPGQATIGSPLAAGTVKKLVNAVQGIKSIKQTVAGYEAEYDETQDQFVCRTSEYLRHKGRAWTPWDYERIVLQKFPQIAQVMCYPGCDGIRENVAGHVLLVVTPRYQSGNQTENTEPKVEASLLTAVTEYIQKHTSAMVTVHTQNPKYERIRVTCKATLRPGYNDKEQYGAMLTRELTAFLAPWTSEDAKLTFQRTLNESDIMAFIKAQPYVDDIIKLEVKQDEETVEMGSYIAPKQTAGILTSSTEHEITFIK